MLRIYRFDILYKKSEYDKSEYNKSKFYLQEGETVIEELDVPFIAVRFLLQPIRIISQVQQMNTLRNQRNTAHIDVDFQSLDGAIAYQR